MMNLRHHVAVAGCWIVVVGMTAHCGGIAHDEHENLVVVGWDYEEIDGERVGPGTIRKLDPTGTELWLETIEQEGYTQTAFYDVAIGHDGQIVAVGSTATAESASDPLIVSVGP